MTPTYVIDPLQDPRWAEFVDRHPRASVFHTPGWISAVRHTYGYQPIVLTTSAPGRELRNGIVFCRIKSFLTGRRLISMPFADHCEPLVDTPDDLEVIVAHLRQEFDYGKWKYVEIRPRTMDCPPGTLFFRSETFYLHTLPLRPEIDQLFRAFHRNSVQQPIGRSQREGLTYEEGSSEELLNKFYRLLLLTRRRHRLPPQPRDWFGNLKTSMGERLKIHVASKDDQPIASIITLRHHKLLVYKYGCSDPRVHNLGGVPSLIWKAIQQAKHDGLQEFDFGRSDLDNPGLIKFKDHWGSARSMLTYLRYPSPTSQSTAEKYGKRLARRIMARAPDGILRLAGELLYKHVG